MDAVCRRRSAHNEEGAARANSPRKTPGVEPGYAICAVELGKGLQHAAVLGTCHVRLDDCLCRVDRICRGGSGASQSTRLV